MKSLKVDRFTISTMLLNNINFTYMYICQNKTAKPFQTLLWIVRCNRCPKISTSENEDRQDLFFTKKVSLLLFLGLNFLFRNNKNISN